MEFDRVIFGRIKDVTDKQRYTKSFEIPNEEIKDNYLKKIEIEAPYHELTNGGHITEISIGNNSNTNASNNNNNNNNFTLIKEILNDMYKKDIGFAKIISTKGDGPFWLK